MKRDFDYRDNLENMIDTTSLSLVLEAISEICMGKALHVQENWQEVEDESPLFQFWAINAKCFEDHRARVERSERELGIQA